MLSCPVLWLGASWLAASDLGRFVRLSVRLSEACHSADNELRKALHKFGSSLLLSISEVSHEGDSWPLEGGPIGLLAIGFAGQLILAGLLVHWPGVCLLLAC